MPLSVEVEKQKIQSSLHSDLSPQPEYDPEIEKRVIRKCDLRVVPPTLLLFALSFLDRVWRTPSAMSETDADLCLFVSRSTLAMHAFKASRKTSTWSGRTSTSPC